MRLFHAPTRREVLLASGTLFAWAHLPKLAHAEGRDPRFLAIVLRGALDGRPSIGRYRDSTAWPDGFRLRPACRQSGRARGFGSPRARRRRPSRYLCRLKCRSGSTRTTLAARRSRCRRRRLPRSAAWLRSGIFVAAAVVEEVAAVAGSRRRSAPAAPRTAEPTALSCNRNWPRRYWLRLLSWRVVPASPSPALRRGSRKSPVRLPRSTVALPPNIPRRGDRGRTAKRRGDLRQWPQSNRAPDRSRICAGRAQPLLCHERSQKEASGNGADRQTT
jgi:hypothetical protein